MRIAPSHAVERAGDTVHDVVMCALPALARVRVTA